MSTIDELMQRRSVRVYDGRPLPDEAKSTIIAAALNAPTAGNMCLYTIIDVTNPAVKETLSHTCDEQPFIKDAPAVLLFVADYQRWYDALSRCCGNVRKPGCGDMLLACCDAVIAAQNAVVAAESLGIGSCYIGDIIENCEAHTQLLNLPRYAMPVCMLCLGYPTEQQKARPKPPRPGAQYVVFQNSYPDNRDVEGFFTSRGEDMTSAASAIYRRKWSQPFKAEMTRSVNA